MSSHKNNHCYVPALVAVVLILAVLACGHTTPASEQIVSTATSEPTKTQAPATPGPSATPMPLLTNRLLLQRLESPGYGSPTYLWEFVGIYELQEGWSGPRKVTDPGFDTSAITGAILAISPDRQYLVFAPHFLFDTDTGGTVPLPVPGITDADPDYAVYAEFSPDGRSLAYRLGYPHYALFVLEIISHEARLIRQSKCATYGNSRECEQQGFPTWIDSDTLIFGHHEGLPGSYIIASPDDPHSINHLTVTTSQGETILSMEAPDSEYRAISGTVFRYWREDIWADAWLDGTDLRNGVYEPHELPMTSSYYQGPVFSTVSPDGSYMLAVDEDSRWYLIEVRTGQTTMLGTRYRPDVYRHPNELEKECLWSPDEDRVACLVEDKEGTPGILVVPLSQQPGGIVFTDQTSGIAWELFDWHP